ncbi:peptide deformylase Def [Thermoclostridium stercorarium subsp. stercorarium DSM 8532]|jgi:peptide deformylase|uniref:Peptide deformylase n=2 Tax=Thermoclostridium stercorarium TaxID=1510 RepID=L7VPG4_THES1|nr:peptide deformylase [Thermoclostridium stercorarium]AGC68341.1 peptide deformylase Def [Thermoclostridium stercorarium subsp. stercorarium DSM 8532]AGI39365.1 peptide deformylase [Thermoclostridium stercorarium subsp. stercorarium DSM 8532]ANW98684.1 peptide deformylase [Thermoclostridium stercorarium subsp. thermolacticum DSM 2910]UZQ86847.1 peptide deformylase [Thermoclostridium stercorarium]
MAIRQIRKKGDEILRKKSKPVKEINDRINELIDDMLDTMYDANGVGLAAPQVGVLKRICVIDVGEGPIVLINPEKIEESAEQVVDIEGCLSIPGVYGEVKRPERVVVKALNRKGESFTIEGTGLLARALCHEMDHLDGILFEDKVIRYVDMDNEN